MRIISGERKGMRLFPPAGMDTRPTTDKVKEAVFDAIQFYLDGASVLDLFAGSGQMGLEALSRGAEKCVFCDKDSRARKAIERNIAACGYGERSHLLASDSLSFLQKSAPGSFDVIFLDPPYGEGLLEKSLELIYSFDIISSRGIIICESGEPLEHEPPPPYRIKKRYRYGRIFVTAVVKQVPDENSDGPGEL